MHLDDERVQRLLHGELPRSVEAAAREHLAGCAECRERVALAEREEQQVGTLLQQLDDTPPALEVGAIVARAGATRRESSLLLQVAGFVLALGVAGAVYAAYAAPGSPLRAWVVALAQRIGGHREAQPPAFTSALDPRGAGIAVAPGSDLLILFTAPEVAGTVRVSLIDSTDVAVHAPIGAATFTSDAERLVIDNRGASATFQIEIPRAAPRVEIRVGQITLFLKEGPRVTTGASADTSGSYMLPLTPP